VPAVVIEPSDLRRHPACKKIDEDLAEELISGTLARAARYAPCITSSTFADAAAAKDLLVGAIVRRYASGAGGFKRETTTVDGVTHTKEADPARSASLFTRAEIGELQDMCAKAGGDMPVNKPRYSGFPDADFPVTS
jgi:hypothetical protein